MPEPPPPEIQKAVDTLTTRVREMIDEATENCIKRSDLDLGEYDENPLPEEGDVSIAQVIGAGAARDRDALGRLGSGSYYKLGSSWKKESETQWSSNLDFAKIRNFMVSGGLQKGLLNYSTIPGGAGVSAVNTGQIWQHRVETLEMLMALIEQVPIDSRDGASKSLEISGLDHPAIADNADPVSAGTSTIEDIGGALQGQIKILVFQIFMQEMLKSLVAELKTATSDSDATEVVTGVATSLPSSANTPAKLADLFLNLGPQFWGDAILLCRGEITRAFVDWSLSAGSARGFSDLVNGIASRSLSGRSSFYQRAFSSNLLDSGSSADDVSAYCFSPSIARIFMKNEIQSRFSLSPSDDAWYLTVASRFKIAILDRTGLSFLKTAAS